jgi:hypothetical protein
LVAIVWLRLTGVPTYIFTWGLGTDVVGVPAVAVGVAPHAVAVHAIAGVTFVSSTIAVSDVLAVWLYARLMNVFSKSYTMEKL